MYSLVTTASPSWKPAQFTGYFFCMKQNKTKKCLNGCNKLNRSHITQNNYWRLHFRSELTAQLVGSLITAYNVQNGVPVSAPMNQAAAMLPNFVMPGLKPANSNFSFGLCEFTSHNTNLSQLGECLVKR